MQSASIGLGLVGGAFQALGQIQEGNAANAAAKSEARMQEMAGVQASDVAATRAAQRIREGRKAQGTAAAAAGESGAAPSGSVMDVLASSERDIQQDALNEKYQGDITRYNYDTQAAFTRLRGRQAQRAGYMGAIGTGLKSLTGAASSAAGYGW